MAEDKKPRQYYKTSKKWREHEMSLKLLDVCAVNPDVLYLIGAAGGFGVSFLTDYIQNQYEAPKTTEDESNWEVENVKYGPFIIPDWKKRGLEGFYGRTLDVADKAKWAPIAASPVTWQFVALFSTYENMKTEFKENPLASTVMLAGSSFGTFCLLCLLFRSMSGGEEGKGMLGSLTNLMALGAL